MESNQGIMTFYDDTYDEDEREIRDPLEFIRSKVIISRYLEHDNMNIADIAGGTGVYSFWLAKLGHKVHLLDIAMKHIDIAKSKGKELSVELASYTCADARNLPYENESMDIVLLMGALYHLQERSSRLQCLAEAKRILKPKGVLISTFISRYSSLVGYFKWGFVGESHIKLINESLLTGKYNNLPYFPNAYFHTPEEIYSEMSDAGFTDAQLIAVQGFANPYKFEEFSNDEYKLSELLRLIELTEDKPELLGISKDIIAVGKKY
ncbi:MAG: class I SAM-dependent methyltransferase [Oscillospiraceae bacterium]|jgi:ubiquinone/menaquinone biosynthesis C-methylase UbiE|nr:class I SAM-dependent methyltransferase [Oscillospiraceae bacterium]